MFKVTENVKYKLVLALFYYAGLRLDEVKNFKWPDIDFEMGFIPVKKTKGEKERVFFLHEKLKQNLKENETKNYCLI